MNDFSGAPIETNQAWEILERWRSRRQEVGLIFWGRSATMYTLGLVDEARNGRVQIMGDGARASFNLVGVTFRYGPMQTWPRWPSPPIVEVMALRAEFENGDYLAFAEEPAGRPLSSRSLPR